MLLIHTPLLTFIQETGTPKVTHRWQTNARSHSINVCQYLHPGLTVKQIF